MGRAEMAGGALGETALRLTIATKPATLANVSTFCVHLPWRTPRMLMAVSTATARQRVYLLA